MVQSLVTMTLFLRTNLRPYSIAAGQEYYGVIFFSLIATMFDGFAEETLTARQLSCLFDAACSVIADPQQLYVQNFWWCFLISIATRCRCSGCLAGSSSETTTSTLRGPTCSRPPCCASRTAC